MSSADSHRYPYVRAPLPKFFSERRYEPGYHLGGSHTDGYRATPKAMRAELSRLADIVSATGCDSLVVGQRAKTQKLRHKDWHARAWKTYHPRINAQLRQQFGVPECIFDRRSNAHYIDASVFTLSRLLRLCQHDFTHVLFFDEMRERTSLFVLRGLRDF